MEGPAVILIARNGSGDSPERRLIGCEPLDYYDSEERSRLSKSIERTLPAEDTASPKLPTNSAVHQNVSFDSEWVEASNGYFRLNREPLDSERLE